MNYEYYLNFTVGDIIFSFIITIISYMLIPAIIRIIKKEPFDKKKSFIIALINSIVVGIIFYVIKVETIEDYTGGLSAGPMFLYYFINKWLLEKKFEKIKKSEKKHKKADKVKKGKQLKFDKKIILYIVLGILLISNIVFMILYFTNKGENQLKDNNEGENIKLDDEYWNNTLVEDCVFAITEHVEYIEIKANSSAGVGDVFSKTVPNKKYIIFDNDIGDIWDVNYKLNGDESRYECNEDWYSVTLSDGTEGFVWGGYKGMYVKEY